MSHVVALVHKVKGTFRRNDPFVKYMDKIVSTADSHAAETQPAAVDLDDDVDVDFFDRQDLGVLNRRLRKVQYFTPLPTTPDSPPGGPPPPPPPPSNYFPYKA